MFIHSIDTIVNNNIMAIKANMSKNDALKYFAISKEGFAKIYKEIQSSDWFQYKLPETITPIIKLSLAKYINRVY